VFQKIRTDIITEKTGQTEQIASAEISNNQIQRLRSALLVEDKGALDPAGDNAIIKTSSVNVIKVTTAAYITPEESNDNYIFYNIPADKFTKSKVGAFLKKMKRIVDRNDPLKLIFSGEEKQVARIN
ncbi:MAG: hypothetical protein ABI204_07400, partial [Ginsengibacter sp.]